MSYVTHVSYKEVEKLKEEGRITAEDAKLAHDQHKIISDMVREVNDAESKMMGAIRILNKIEVKKEM